MERITDEKTIQNGAKCLVSPERTVDSDFRIRLTQTDSKVQKKINWNYFSDLQKNNRATGYERKIIDTKGLFLLF